MGAVSLFHPFAAATTTKLGPENEPQGLESREHDSFWEETWFRIPQSIRGCMMRDERLIWYCSPRQVWFTADDSWHSQPPAILACREGFYLQQRTLTFSMPAFGKLVARKAFTFSREL